MFVCFHYLLFIIHVAEMEIDKLIGTCVTQTDKRRIMTTENYKYIPLSVSLFARISSFFLFVRWKIASTMQCDYCCLQRRQLTFIFSPNTHNAQYINSIPTTKPNIWLYSYCLLLYSCPCIFVCIDKRQMSWMQSQSKGSVCIIVARHFQTNFNQNIWFFLSGSNLYFCIWLTSGEGHQWDRVAIEINPSVPGAFLCELIHNSLAVCSFALFSIGGSPRRPCTQRYFAKILVNLQHQCVNYIVVYNIWYDSGVVWIVQ